MEKIKDYTNPITNRFEPGEVVFWKRDEYRSTSYKNKNGAYINWFHSVGWGIVAEHFHDYVVVDLYTIRDNRTVNGIPIGDYLDAQLAHSDSPNDYDAFGWKKLPRGFKIGTDDDSLMVVDYPPFSEEENILFRKINEYDPKAIKQAADNGLLIWNGYSTRVYIPTLVMNNGRYAIHLTLDDNLNKKLRFYSKKVIASELYRTAEIPLREVEEAIRSDEGYIALTDSEYAIKEFEKLIYSLKCFPEWTDERVKKAIEWFKSMPNYEDIDFKRNCRNINWKYYGKKRWNLLPDEVTGVM